MSSDVSSSDADVASPDVSLVHDSTQNESPEPSKDAGKDTSDDDEYEKKPKSSSESPTQEKTASSASRGEDSAPAGIALLHGGKLRLSMTSDVVEIESDGGSVDFNSKSELEGIFTKVSLSPPPAESSVAMVTNGNKNEAETYDWDELGRMMSTGSQCGSRPGGRRLARSPSERIFQARNMETKTVTLGRQKKGYGFQIKGDGPVWISGVDKGSSAEAAGLQVGGVLMEVNGRNVEEVNHDTVLKYIAEGPQPLTLSFQIMRNSAGSLSAAVMSGYMTKQGGTGIVLKNWRRRWFVLRQDGCLYYYKTESDVRPLGAIVLQGYTISKALDVDKKFAFKLTKGGARTYYMLTESEAEMNSWAKALTIASERVDSISSTSLLPPVPSSDSSSTSSMSMSSSAHNVSAPALSIREPDCHGWLFKQGFHHKSWKRRYCVLKSGCLYYYLDMTDQTAKGVMRMEGYMLKRQNCAGKKYYFMAEPPQKDMRPFYFYTTSELEYRRWFSKMQESILNSKS